MYHYFIKTLLLCYLFTGYNHSPAQHGAPILADSILNSGIYMNFGEFKNNAPSVLVTIVPKVIHPQKDLPESFVLFTLPEMEEIKGKVKMKDVWGFCDGNFCYRKLKGGLITLEPHFSKITYLDRYSYYEVLEYHAPTSAPAGSNGTFVSIPGPPPNVIGKVINMNNGKDYFLKENIALILSKDPELMEEFKGDEGAKDNLRHYLIQYCQRHPDELK